MIDRPAFLMTLNIITSCSTGITKRFLRSTPTPLWDLLKGALLPSSAHPPNFSLALAVMRLLAINGASGSILSKTFYDGIPPYAVLSHTWGKDEDEFDFRD